MNIDEYFAEVCRQMGWEPTMWRLTVFGEWARSEGISSGDGYRTLGFHWNPLATTYIGRRSTVDIGSGPGKWNNANNGQGVGIYADAAAGIEATVVTLRLPFYQNIRRCFADQNGYQAAIGPQDFTSWVGSAAYGAAMVNFMNATNASKVDIYGATPPPAAASPLDEMVWRMVDILVGRPPSGSTNAHQSRLDALRTEWERVAPLAPAIRDDQRHLTEHIATQDERVELQFEIDRITTVITLKRYRGKDADTIDKAIQIVKGSTP